MVATTKKKSKNSDVFKTVKAKVGKRAPAKANDTDTAFTAAGLHVVSQDILVQSTDATNTTHRGVTWEHLSQQQAQHPAAAVRRSAVTGIANLVQRQQQQQTTTQRQLPYDPLALLTVVGRLTLIDTDRHVRTEAFSLLQSILVAQFTEQQPVHDHILVPLLHAALNALDAAQSRHAAMVVRWWATHSKVLEERVVRYLLPSLTRLLGHRPTTNGRPHQGVTTKQTKKKKRKRNGGATTTAGDVTTADTGKDERYTVLCAVEALLLRGTTAGRHDSSSRREDTVTHATTTGALLYYKDDRPTKQKKPRLLTTIDTLVASPDRNPSATRTTTTTDDDTTLLLMKLRDLLFEAEPGDDQYTKAAMCLQRLVEMMGHTSSHSIPILSSVVRYLSRHNDDAVDGTVLGYVWKLSRHVPEARTWHTWVTERVIQALERNDDDGTTLLDVVELLLFQSDASEEDRERLQTTFVEQCFRVRPDDNTTTDWTTPYHRQVAVMGCRFLQERKNGTSVPLSLLDPILEQLGDMVLAWQAQYPTETQACLDAMEWKLRTSTDTRVVLVADRWQKCLEPLFERRIFFAFNEQPSIQRRLVCLVTRLSRPSPQLLQYWSSILTDDGHDHCSSDWMMQCAHRMRKTLPMPTYLGFLMDSLGVLEAAEEVSTSVLDRRIRRVGGALLQCGASPKQILSKLKQVLLLMLEKDSAAATRAATSLIALLSLDHRDRRQGEQSMTLAEVGLSSLAAPLAKRLQLLDDDGGESMLLEPKVQLLALYPSLLLPDKSNTSG